MSPPFYDFAYYASLLILTAGYFITLRTYRIGTVSSFFFFRNASVVYFFIFSILLGKLVYDGSALISAQFNERLYFLMLFYGCVLVLIATVFNALPSKSVGIEQFRLNIIPLAIVLCIKGVLLAIETTPLQTFFLDGLIAAHIQQAEWHEPGQGGIVYSFYGYFSAIMTILFLVYYMNARNRLFKLAMLLLAFETSGYYLSKSGMFTPLVVILVLSGIRLRYMIVLALFGVLSVFAIRRLGASDIWSSELLAAIFDRFILETGYSNLHLDLYQAEHPPLGYESRYFIGFNTLFGITPAVDASREAYLIETGKFGGTTSGHAAVALYAFWGQAFYIVSPILIAFIFWVDRFIANRIRTTFGLVAYVFITFKAVNYLTVDLQRLISFQTLIDLTFLSSVAFVFFTGKLLNLWPFQRPIRIYQEYRVQHE